MNNIIIKGARVHNLRNIDITIPKNKLIAVTGVSGSGKSSLVFDIIFEEGRRQYLKSLGILPGIDDEDRFDSISGIGPAIAVHQSVVRQSNPRSTVGSKTNILNLLGILYSKEGKLCCTSCGAALDESLTCGKCGNKAERLPAGYFSYNTPNGMCIKCSGRGAYYNINMEKLVPDNRTTLLQVFDKAGITPGFEKLLHKKYSNYLDVPYSELSDEIQEEVIYGHHVVGNRDNRSYCLIRIFQGRLKAGEDLNGIYTLMECPDCRGFRVGEEARGVTLGGRHIGELGKMTLSELHSFLKELLNQGTWTPFGRNLLLEILDKTGGLIKARLGHLSLYRELSALSGGEIQRLFLNSHLESKLDSLIYILDEPTAGLHESEKTELLKSIRKLKNLGNTVIVVEHDRSSIEMAEHIIDIGPKAGEEGGRIIYQGDLKGLLACADSITGRYLSGKTRMPARESKKNTAIDKGSPCLIIRHATANNLKDITAAFPLGALIGVAGVSGSGKSTLISDTLIPLLKNYFHGRSKGTDKLEGAEQLLGYAEISQAAIGRNMNSNPASYIGIWDKIRRLFAEQKEAIEQGLSAGHFSFNSKGACPACGGSGREAIWLGGNSELYNTCGECHGKRYNEEALAVRYNGKTICDVLEMTVSEAVAFFKGNLKLLPALKVMESIGMGYVKLGQPASTLSGGEAQRIKLAKEIGRCRTGGVLYVLDEPTTGLSLYDTAKLITLLDELIAKGNSVIVIEHNPDMLNSCDWIIELGPGGGAEGGRIIAEGSPQALRDNPDSITGRYL